MLLTSQSPQDRLDTALRRSLNQNDEQHTMQSTLENITRRLEQRLVCRHVPTLHGQKFASHQLDSRP